MKTTLYSQSFLTQVHHYLATGINLLAGSQKTTEAGAKLSQ